MEKKIEDLTYSQQIDIAHKWMDLVDVVSVSELLLQTEEVMEEVNQHPDYIMAHTVVGKDPNWKDYMSETEMEITVKWALKIYNHVKSIIEPEKPVE